MVIIKCSRELFSSYRYFALLGLAALLGPSARAGDGPPPVSDLRVTVIENGEEGPRATTTMPLEDETEYWTPPETFAPQFAEGIRIEVDRSPTVTARGEALVLMVRFSFKSAKDPARKVLVDLKALDESGKVLHHTWQLQPDLRIGPTEVHLGSRKAIRSTVNHARLEIPDRFQSRLRAVEITLREMHPADYRHFAPQPSNIDLRMTRPDRDGNFEVSFTNPGDGTPDATQLDPETHRLAIVLAVKDASGKLQERVVRFTEARKSGRYRVSFRVRPEFIDHSTLSLAFFTKQPDNEDFVRRFFIEGRGAAYSGMWLGGGGDLIEIPYEDPVRE
jgi:hypothetical protein